MTNQLRHVAAHDHDGIPVIELLDRQLNEFETVSAVRDEILQVIEESRAVRAVLDLKKVEYLTSVALLPFVDVRKTMADAGGQVVLCNLAPVVAQVLTVAQLIVESRAHARHLVVASDVEAAIALLNAE